MDEWVDLNSKRIYSIQDGKWQYDKLPDYLVKELNNLKMASLCKSLTRVFTRK
ncbi:hypothetical protein SDC49_02050 [Lactobacillus sp. R2/2]|nr:hypothetical protein [Lactobacillus sp. R2/2]